jgi:hypothetical protein
MWATISSCLSGSIVTTSAPRSLQNLATEAAASGIGRVDRSHEAGPPLEQVGLAVLPARLFGARHGMRAHKVGAPAQGLAPEPRDLGLDAADVADDRVRLQAGDHLAEQGHDQVDRSGDDHHRGLPSPPPRASPRWRAPRLLGEGEPRLGPPRPQDDAARHSPRARGARHGATNQAGREDGELLQHSRKDAKSHPPVEPFVGLHFGPR